MRRLVVLALLGGVLPAHACNVPIAYAVGEVDKRFDRSRAEFRAAVRDAARLWEEAAGRKLFEHRPGADFRINLAYGPLQEATERIQGLEKSADSLRVRIEERQDRLEAVKARFEGRARDFEAEVQELRRDRRAFEARLRKVREAGGAAPGEGKALEERRRELQERVAELQARQEDLKELQARLDRLAAETNALIERHNQQVREANERARPGREYRQGYYQRTGWGDEEITIRQYEGPRRLRFALAHELGHALGIGHVDEAGAVMHRVNEGGKSTPPSLTAADRAALREACGTGGSTGDGAREAESGFPVRRP
ncbi:hypothetical protein AN478_00275 [Thiohalorhabdus denitrificans]|uniref:Matrixin n=1 Tax=Thiohalorhabdus denitrificans TaxID=381306 RepID=A0A0P9C9P1_9GAMM|nr:matrixin family metalloprotease [Thiohalorhabdus denitrificans]KPV41875.1 hypothetical protein AN478_00275 [Thiohalorhabdus denitrificans]SCY65105.1 Matrixin [Thiohalorhabdus denitrificans]